MYVVQWNITKVFLQLLNHTWSKTFLPSVISISIVLSLITIIKSFNSFNDCEKTSYSYTEFQSLPASEFSKLITQLNAKLTGSGFYCIDVDSTAVEIFRDETKLVKYVWWYGASAAYISIIAPVILDDTSSAWESPLCPHTLMRLSFIWIIQHCTTFLWRPGFLVDLSKHKSPHIKSNSVQ